MKQKLLFLLCALSMAISAGAYDYDFEYDYDGKTLCFNRLSQSTCELVKGNGYSSFTGELIIPSVVKDESSHEYTVTALGESALAYCQSLTSVVVPNTVTEIGPMAFANCFMYAPSSITLSNSLVSIGEKAFYTCMMLNSIELPNTLTTIGDYAFYCCYGLTSLEIPKSVTTVGGGAFYWSGISQFNGENVTEDGFSLIIDHKLVAFAPEAHTSSYTIPTTVTEIGDYAFYNCHLRTVTIPDTVTKIGEKAFCYSGLRTVEIPNSVTSIGSEAFGSNGNLAQFKGKFASEDGRCLIVDNKLIAFAPADLTSYTIPASVTAIDNYIFNRCTDLQSIVLPDGLTSIGQYTFTGCTGITLFTLPESLTTIGKCAFSGCTGLTSIKVPQSVSSVGGGAFCSCNNLARFEGVHATDDGRCLIINHELVGFAHPGVTSYAIPASVTAIGDYAFYYCSDLESISIPNTVKSIGYYAFCHCSGFTSLEIPEGVKTIGDWAFPWCSGLTSIEIPNSVTSIGEGAFYVCRNLAKVSIGDGVAEIGSEAFYGCPAEEITIGAGVKTIGKEAFGTCNKLKKFYSAPTIPPTCSKHVFNFVDTSACTLYVPESAINSYKIADQWKDFGFFETHEFGAGINDVFADEATVSTYKIYNLSGALLKVTTDKAEIYTLPAGIYIVNNRKVIVR